MNTYITGTTIRQLREKNALTQNELADKIGVSAKAVSRWETGKGFLDISLIEPLAEALNISVIELMSGNLITNENKSSNMLRSKMYVCPICGNVIHTTGEAVISCCGVTLPVLEAEKADEKHRISIEKTENEQFITVYHEMTKKHYISFVAYVTSDKIEMVKFYPEGNAETRMHFRGHGYLYVYCNQHGLMYQEI